jgi:hypothetical protein
MAMNYAQSSSNGTLPAESKDSETTMTLLRKLLDEVTLLIRQELALAGAELSRSMSKLLAGAGSIATGGAVLFAGFLVLLASAVIGLSNVVEPWLAALIVGVVVGVIGGVMVFAGIKALDPEKLKPKRSTQSIQQDKEVLTRKDS